jgi:hypothetical protein
MTVFWGFWSIGGSQGSRFGAIEPGGTPFLGLYTWHQALYTYKYFIGNSAQEAGAWLKIKSRQIFIVLDKVIGYYGDRRRWRLAHEAIWRGAAADATAVVTE